MISVLPHEGEKDEFHEIEVTWRKNSDPTGTYLQMGRACKEMLCRNSVYTKAVLIKMKNVLGYLTLKESIMIL